MDINTKFSYVTDSTTNVINGTYVLSPYFVNMSVYLILIFVYALIDLVFAEFSFYSLFSFALAAIWLNFPIIDGIWLNLGLFILTNYGMRCVFLKMSAYTPWLASEYALKFIKKEGEELEEPSEGMEEESSEELEEPSECCGHGCCGSDRITLEHRPSYPAAVVETFEEEPGVSVEDVVEAVIVSEVVSEVVESIIDNSSEESYQSESTDYSPSSYETSDDSSSDDED